MKLHVGGVRTAKLVKAREVPEMIVAFGFHVPDLTLDEGIHVRSPDGSFHDSLVVVA
jgi:hypothetical protein